MLWAEDYVSEGCVGMDVRLAADHFEVPKSTLADRMSGKKTRRISKAFSF
jgi:hypothetical protein